jgi:RNA-directed DNA polymerase
MTHLAQLKAATALTDVALLLGFQPAGLSYVLYKKSPAAKYSTFEIPKRFGGTRKISAPTDDLKLLQRRLADVLQNCAAEINAINNFRDQFSHGFKRERSIITNAAKHRRRRFVFNLDLHDFFPSINFGRVRGFFIKNKHFALNNRVATILAQIACFDGGLPQGSPCSPVVSNLIGHVLDIHLARLAFQTGCTYTRYADDLTFSTNEKSFPVSVAYRRDSEPHVWTAGEALARLINKSGFEINNSKTRMQYRDSRQTVTGLIVNERINVRREYRHTVRAMVHRLVNTGSFEFTTKVLDDKGASRHEAVPGAESQLHGMLGFIDEVDRYNRRRLREGASAREQSPSKLSTKELMYRRFLLFTQFYAAPRPIVVCEGATDNVYLVHAIRSLASAYPRLATIESDGTKKLAIRLFRYAGSGTGRILGIESGGASNLAKLIRQYHKEKERFKAPGLTHPMIVLIDNDSAAKAIYEVIGQIRKPKPTGKEAFIPVTGNLYVVPSPYNAVTNESVIEDCFDRQTKAIQVEGKTFKIGNDFEPDKHFGKIVFAHRVIRKQADVLNFQGFVPILDRIASVITAHEAAAAEQRTMDYLKIP